MNKRLNVRSLRPLYELSELSVLSSNPEENTAFLCEYRKFLQSSLYIRAHAYFRVDMVLVQVQRSLTHYPRIITHIVKTRTISPVPQVNNPSIPF